MSHRALQILNAVGTLIASPIHVVFKHRAESVSQIEQELPASIVRIGEDSPPDDDGASNLAFIDSLLTIEIDHLVKESDETTAIDKLIQLRAITHQALMAGGRNAGLAFVIDVRYAGASEPALEVQTDSTTGRLTSRWLVHYRMNITDPA